MSTLAESAGACHNESPGVVIVGAGHAGGRCALALRKEGYTGRIVLVGDEAHWPYERPPLSKACITSSERLEQSCPAMVSATQRLDLAIDHFPSVPVKHVEPRARRVHTAQGRVLRYDHLVLATGSRPRPWALDGVPSTTVFQLHTLDDAERLKQAMVRGRKALFVGGGFIGLELAAAALKLGCHVTVVEPQQRLLARALSPAASEHMRQLHASRGADVRLGRSIVAATASDLGLHVVLDDGCRVPYDIVIAGIGSVPNTELAVDAGLAMCSDTRGILVDAHCRTSEPRIYAIGDIASKANTLYSRQLRLESWDNAESQAGTVAAAIAGHVAGTAIETPAANTTVPWFWTDQHGLNLQILGFCDGADRTILRGDLTTKGVQFHLKGDRVIGAELFNSARERRLIKGWIQHGTALDTDLLRDSHQALALAAQALTAMTSPQEK